MSTHAATRTRRRGGAAAARRRRAVLRRRLIALAAAAGVGVLVLVATPEVKHAAREIALPLRHEDVIRQQAAAKDLDPALVAGVIYTESHFVDQTSHAGARGLMQITPATAHAIAQSTGGTAFTEADLATPQVNIAYGTWYLRHLLDLYGGDEVAALAAYNAGIGNVNRWRAATGGQLTVDEIPFAETRAYVTKVMTTRDQYRRKYARELGYG
jgi:soluble lytic murein transglycosylase